jgi:hypothetical protein
VLPKRDALRSTKRKQINPQLVHDSANSILPRSQCIATSQQHSKAHNKSLAPQSQGGAQEGKSCRRQHARRVTSTDARTLPIQSAGKRPKTRRSRPRNSFSFQVSCLHLEMECETQPTRNNGIRPISSIWRSTMAGSRQQLREHAKVQSTPKTGGPHAPTTRYFKEAPCFSTQSAPS